MKTKLLFCILALALVVTTVPAQSPYRQGEVTVETFATHTFAMASPAADLKSHDGIWGYGAGLTYFFHRNFGFGFEAVVLDGGSPSSTTLDELSLNLTARVPLGQTGWAPYATLGGGRNIESGQYLGHVGAGLEYRFTKVPLIDQVSVFAEGRYQWVRSDLDAAQVRGGIRFSF
jgi:hypothetical protein